MSPHELRGNKSRQVNRKAIAKQEWICPLTIGIFLHKNQAGIYKIPFNER
jgi:hypothetical protein